MSVTYNPSSYFFVDPSVLVDANSTNLAVDAFGPVSGNLTTQYRTTSFVRLASPILSAKVFAICKGRILIQPMDGDNTKINLILKPEGNAYAPIKIKYFIYRGINKSDWIDSLDNLIAKSTSNPLQPKLLQNLWDDYTKYYLPGITPSTFPAKRMGYNPFVQTNSMLLDTIFNASLQGDETYQLPVCNGGEYIGNFSNTLGLDIVLDYGDYQLEHQEELFKLDLAYARKNEHVFDLGLISASATMTKADREKRYKEYIHQFMDAAAFWGSHIECGNIKLSDGANLKTNTEIYTTILKKYQTKNKIYTYIIAERGRSYNYYEATRTIDGFAVASQLNITNGWPILIKELVFSIPPSNNKENISFTLEYSFDTDIRLDETQRYIAVDIISPNNDTSKYPLAQNLLDFKSPPNPRPSNDRTNSITIDFQTNDIKSVSSFLFVCCNLKQIFPLTNYYDDLWVANIKTPYQSVELNADTYCSSTYLKPLINNLHPILDTGGYIQNQVIVDTGKNSASPSSTKKRKLFLASFSKNTIHYQAYDKLNVNTVNSSFYSGTLNIETYGSLLYNNPEFSVYKGMGSDGGVNFKTLTLYHNSDFQKKNSFFHLGITEEEYNIIMYDNPLSPTPHLPVDADMVYFHLEEIKTPTIILKNFRKYRVGLKYENSTLTTSILFPSSPANDVFVYTVDGFYFFSKDYSEHQTFYKEFAKAKVEFRTKIAVPGSTPPVIAYDGEFGFDWIRDGDNGEPTYESIIQGGYEVPSIGDLNTEYENKQEAYKGLKREYNILPTQKVDENYFIPYLNLFSKAYSNSITTVPAPPYEAELRVFVRIEENLNKLEFDYNTNLFTIDIPILADKLIRPKSEGTDKTIKITCLKEFNDCQQIRILAYPVGVVDKNQAKVAGIILIDSNDSLSRVDSDIVLVSVLTDIDNNGATETGYFMPKEVVNLRNILHQGLIYGNIKTSSLDLTNGTTYPQFKQQFDVLGNPIIKGFIHSDGGVLSYFDNISSGIKLHHFLKNEFLANPLNSIYRNHFIVFAVDRWLTTTNGTNALGDVDDIGVHLVVLYNPFRNPLLPRDYTTLNHEVMHGYGLYHTHRDGPIKEPQIEFIYPHAFNPPLPNPLEATDNVMSYNSNAITLWAWQRKIINIIK